MREAEITSKIYFFKSITEKIENVGCMCHFNKHFIDTNL
jgi:hypothetical protein